MPKIPIDYSKTLIYKISCYDTTVKEIYVGQTTDFRRRKNAHKTDCNKPERRNYNSKLCQFIRDNKGWSNFEMVLVEKYPCSDSLESLQRENYWYDKLNTKEEKQPIKQQEEIKTYTDDEIIQLIKTVGCERILRLII